MNERPEIRYISNDGTIEKFYGCDVCYTCIFFFGDLRCYWPMKRIGSDAVGDKIKKPEWHRCRLWKPKDGNEKRRKKT
jgi:hypothetical protein